MLGEKANALQNGYPRWSYLSGCTHGGIILIIIYALGVTPYFDQHPKSSVNTFLKLSGGEVPTQSVYAMEQIFCCINGYLLKDYYLFPEGLELGFLVHHIASIVGDCMCLSFPTGAAYIALNGAMAEFGSVFYNLKELVPSRASAAIYYIMMAFSNLSCTYISYQICFNLNTPEPWEGIYCFLAILILFIRWAGYGMQIKTDLLAKNE